MRPTSRPRPMVALLSLALSVLLLASTPASAGFGEPPAPVISGQVGEWALANEAADLPGVRCLYDYRPAADIYKLYRFRVRPPRIWWPDTNSSVDDQHGLVGWQVRVQRSLDSGLSWSKAYETGVQKKVAYEDSVAPYARRTIDWSASGNAWYRVRHRLLWYRGDGSIRGSVLAWTYWYGLGGELQDAETIVGGCRNKAQEPNIP